MDDEYEGILSLDDCDGKLAAIVQGEWGRKSIQGRRRRDPRFYTDVPVLTWQEVGERIDRTGRRSGGTPWREKARAQGSSTEQSVLDECLGYLAYARAVDGFEPYLRRRLRW
jgi:hypothetical protein